MAELNGRTILVTGATGNVGWGAACAARESGARLILPTRSEEGRDRLEEEFGGLARVLRTEIGTEAGIKEVVRLAQDGDGLDHVVAPIGSWWQKGHAIDQETSELEELLDIYTTTQFRMVKATAPLLRHVQGSYTVVTGAAGEAPHIHGAGLLVVAVKAQLALAEVLKAEHEDDDFRFNEFRIATRVEREPRPGVVPAIEVGRALMGLLTEDTRSRTIRYPEA